MSKTVVARVLCFLPLEGREYQPNALVEFSDKDAKWLKESGQIDDDKSAVAYVKNKLSGTVVKHVSATAEPETASESGN